MKGRDQLLDILEFTRSQVASGEDREDWFHSFMKDFEVPSDGSDESQWRRLESYVRKYSKSGREKALWSIIGILYDLSRWYLDRPVTRVKGIGEVRAEKLSRLGVHSLYDLITHFPRAYTDRRFVDDIRDAEEGETATLFGEVLSGEVVEGRNPRYEVRLGDETGSLRINFWNQTYLKNRIHKGTRLFCTGEIEVYRATKQLNNPNYEIIEDDEDLESSKGIKPIYPLTEGIHLEQLRNWIRRTLEMVKNLVIDCLPRDLRRNFNLVSIRHSLDQIHEPKNFDELMAARRRLIFEEFFFFQFLFVWKGWQIEQTPKSRSYPSSDWKQHFLKKLPYDLTHEQVQALREIEGDLLSDAPMHRLLQGDVGTGKTVVATASLLRVAENGYQTAMMAPTEVLAEQHFRTLRNLLAELPCKVDLLVGGIDSNRKETVLARLGKGNVDLVVGTHALIQAHVNFSKLGYVIIDEQHRFGVEQRRDLRDKGPDVDVLVMSATPIPRSLALTNYGDLTFSTLRTFPQGPREISTRLLEQTEENRRQVYQTVRRALEADNKAFFVFPAIEENKEDDITSAMESYRRASESDFFGGIDVGLIHGRMSRDEKQDRMKRFQDGSIQLLFSTTVIEVGIDVPQASYLVVHGAEHFGLAQLHQLRGRIGREGQKARCYLLVSSDAPEKSFERLKILEATQDGFEVSKADMKHRGIGDLIGTRQAGFQPFELGDVREHRELLEKARAGAEQVFDRSRGIDDPRCTLINRKLEHDYQEEREYVWVG